MKENVKISFYDIHKCGYYKYGADKPEFFDVGSLFIDLQEWINDNDKNLSETCTYEISEADNGVLRTFCLSLRLMSNGEVLLTTWNETETTDGAVASVDGASSVGSPNISTTDIPQGHIPGYPTYFWFIPSMGIFATLRFSSRLNGHVGLKLWLSEYIAKFSSHVEFDKNDKIIGYKKEKNSEVLNLYSRFESSPMRQKGKLDYLKSNITDIKKIFRKTKLSPVNTNDINLLEKIWINLGISSKPTFHQDINIKAELPYQPSKKELDSMITEWQDDEQHSQWNDIGFRLKGSQEINWLSHTLVKGEIEFDIAKDGNGVISLDSLENEIKKNRSILLNLAVNND